MIASTRMNRKSFEIHSKINLKGSKNPPKLEPKSRKSEPRGTPKRQQEANMKNIEMVSNSVAVF